MNSNEIRKRFLDFFAARGHRVVRSSSLVPANDPTLLFTNAGMNQFKDVFLGREKRDYTRACSSQKCVRAGGKHNDLEQVGRTARHLTFFQMLGNFSFGDYFKGQAIPWAWELITKVYKIPKDKLYATVFEGSTELSIPRDAEAHEIWLKTGVPADRVFELSMKDNFWAMGDTGPCGPCSEIFYDLGPPASGVGHTDCKFPCDCGRYTELWNLVFMQFNRDEQGALAPLPRPSIDTGAGLERLSAVLQGKLLIFDADLFRPLINEAAELGKVEYGASLETDVSLRIIADHARASTFLISDGVLPSNEGRGYVLRLIMRRALYHGQTLGLNEPFLYKMSGHVVDMMKDAYPELVETAHHVAKAIKTEEQKYAQTTKIGLENLDQAHVVLNSGEVVDFATWMARRASAEQQAAQVHSTGAAQSTLAYSGYSGRIRGDDLFRLHDTYGLRPDFVQDVLRKYGLEVDRAGYEAEMQKQRERARASWKGAEKKTAAPVYQRLGEKQKTEFEGYLRTTSPTCKIVALVQSGQSVNEAKAGAEVEIVLDHTPFYAEAGGQVGDIGHFFAPGGTHEVAHVNDTYAPVTGLIAHRAVAKDIIQVGDVVTAVVDVERRDAIRRNHTATHLLHAALRNTLGPHVKQAGSLVAPDRLRFDFSHYAALGEQDLLDIEDLVNPHILANEEMHTEVMDLDAAVNSGAIALFGEKYGDKVRVVSVADGTFSKELCGGTHVGRTGDIGLFKVIAESSVAAGTRRIEALTGQGVLEYLRNAYATLTQLSEALRAKPDEVLQAAQKLTDSEKKLRKELESREMKRAASEARGLVEQAREVKGVRVISARVEVAERAALRHMIDNLRAKIGSGVIVLGSVTDGKVSLVAAVTQDMTNRLDAGKIVKEAARIVDGTGGGRKDLAEAGGRNSAKLDASLRAVPAIIEKML